MCIKYKINLLCSLKRHHNRLCKRNENNVHLQTENIEIANDDGANTFILDVNLSDSMALSNINDCVVF